MRLGCLAKHYFEHILVSCLYAGMAAEPLNSGEIREGMMNERKNPCASMAASTRRKLITGAVVAVGSLIAGPCAWANAQANQEKIKEPQSTGVEGLLTYLHQEIDIKASRQRIYDALLDSKQFAAFSGMPAEINREAGGTFSMFGGLIIGRNVYLCPMVRIVPASRLPLCEAGHFKLYKIYLSVWCAL